MRSIPILPLGKPCQVSTLLQVAGSVEGAHCKNLLLKVGDISEPVLLSLPFQLLSGQKEAIPRRHSTVASGCVA